MNTRSQDQKKAITTLRYLTTPVCIGSDCENTCCKDWRIFIDRGTYKKMKNLMGRSKKDQQLFRRSFKRIRDHGIKGEHSYAEIVQLANGHCPFFDKDRLCSVQKKYGEAALSMTCRIYPRKINLIGNRHEISANLSCPEAARRCLLRENSTETVSLPADSLSGRPYPVAYVQAEKPEDPYLQYFDTVRELFLQLLSVPGFPFSSRIFFCLYFAHRSIPFFHKTTTTFTEQKLACEVDRIATPENLGDLHAQYQGLTPPLDLPMSIIQTILLARRRHGVARDFVNLLDRIATTYEKENEAKGLIKLQESGEAITVDSRQLVEAYRYRSTRLEHEYGDLLDSCFENYSRNYWYAEPYPQSANLLVHAQKLIIRLAVVRFLLFSHPDLDPLFDQAERKTSRERRNLLARTAIQVFYEFSRHIEHDEKLTNAVNESLASQGMDNFAHLALLLKF